MKIDWKHLATTPGYISLKKATAESLTWRWGPTKKEAQKTFNEIISRAKNHAHVTGDSVADVLTNWEEIRNNKQRLSSFYSNHHMPKARNKDSLERQGIKGGRKYNKQWNRDKQALKRLNCRMINEVNRLASTKIKPRWNMARKKREAEHLHWLKTGRHT